MTRRWPGLGAGLLTIAIVALGGTAYGDQWNDKTILTFSEPVMIPNATLPAGTYVFRLADSRMSRHLVRVYTEDESRLITTVQAVPVKRPRESNETAIRFNPTSPGTPVAIKAWFAPGSAYGHEFVYPEDQARQIADRTRTVVLAVDVPDSDLQRGTLRTISETGERRDWQGDAATTKEWESWQRSRVATGAGTPSTQERPRASAAVGQAARDGMRVRISALEEAPRKYIGQRISVDAEVEEVFGPTLFTIDEPNWGDLDGEILVFMPSALATLVQEDDRVTISGTVESFVLAEVEREWGWFGDSELEAEYNRKPVLRADRIIGGDDNRAMVIEISPSRAGSATPEGTASSRQAQETPVGTGGRAGNATAAESLADLRTLAMGDEELVGRSVALQNARVTGVDPQGGFFVTSGDRHIFVLPAHDGAPTVSSGDTVTVSGHVLRMPRRMDDRLAAPGSLNDDIYVYATVLTKTR